MVIDVVTSVKCDQFAEGSGPFKLLFSCARWH